MLQDFIPANRPDLLNTAIQVVDMFNAEELPHSEAATIALAIFAAIGKRHTCCTGSCATAASNVASYLAFRALRTNGPSPDSARIAADAKRFAAGVPQTDQDSLTESVRDTHEYLIAKGMPIWQYFDTLVSLYVSAVEAHPDQRHAAHLFGARLQAMFPINSTGEPSAASRHNY